MKVTFTQAKKKEPVTAPYFANYGDGEGVVIFVTRITEQWSDGYLVTGNSQYKPFEYFSMVWENDNLTPIESGVLTMNFNE